MDFGYEGPTYTWCNNKYEPTRAWERLERDSASNKWMDLARFESKDYPMLLIIKWTRFRSMNPFKFEKFWLSNDSIHEVAWLA